MSNPSEPEGPPAKRGEAAWKQTKERVAERNVQARKAGKARREAYEAQRARSRAENERREMAQWLERREG